MINKHLRSSVLEPNLDLLLSNPQLAGMTMAKFKQRSYLKMSLAGAFKSKGIKDKKKTPVTVSIFQNKKGVLNQSPRECCSLPTIQVFFMLENSLQLQSVVNSMILRI